VSSGFSRKSLKETDQVPRKRSIGQTTSAFRQVQQRARAPLGNLRNEIRVKETELGRLKGEHARLSALVGGAPRAAQRGGGGGGRVNWRNVLSQLPRQFKTSDIRGVRGLKSKRPSEIFPAITRWIDAGLAKRKAPGLYAKA
jgi:hypothetical protein